MNNLLNIKQNIRKMADAGATEQEIDEYAQLEGATPNMLKNIKLPSPISFLPGAQRTEQMISQRPSAWQNYVKEAMTPYDFQQHPFKSALKPLVSTLKLANVPIQQGLLSPLANIGMEMQEKESQVGKGRRVLESIIPPLGLTRYAKPAWQGVTGQRPGTMADIPRRAGMPDWLSELVGFGAEIGTLNLASRGRLISSAKKVEQVARQHSPQLMSKDYVIDRVNKMGEGVDELYKGLGDEYEALYNKIGNQEISGKFFKGKNTIQELQNVIDDLSESTIKKLVREGVVIKNPDDTYQALKTLNALKKMKSVIRAEVPARIWSGRTIGDYSTARLEQAYGKIADIMAQGNEELANLNERYAQFRNMSKTVNRYLFDNEGNPIAKKIMSLYGKKGERGHQIIFEQFAKQWPQALQLLKDIKKFESRLSMKQGLGYFGKRALIYGGLAYPAMNRLSNALRESTGAVTGGLTE